ncbi:hypothetical protein LL912_10825 [Niabella sp. CC-SYL272]|uniref:hypothetical protein n=1 Tax=Niabella agricola TaxID=2891571 RepID=UPI001F2C5862|nr:hypothetical protein [Niabella agricola]MCF3109273.1 hypothetical protein [Niabella agricola]
MPVVLAFGHCISDKDGTLTVGTVTITLNAGQTDEFGCRDNCPFTPLAEEVLPSNIVRMIMDDSVKSDTNCVDVFNENDKERVRCEKDSTNFFNSRQWIDARD